MLQVHKCIKKFGGCILRYQGGITNLSNRSSTAPRPGILQT